MTSLVKGYLTSRSLALQLVYDKEQGAICITHNNSFYHNGGQVAISLAQPIKKSE
ncbi:hypothetical protein J14TS2_29290 [Bacillus sp. J14TS2]|nr:hypothetical protein J14TS2_29290 [Bacillus sp. J14TS2]